MVSRDGYDTNMNDSESAGDLRKLAGLVLAAGESARLGQPKQLLVYREQTLIEQSISLASEFCDAGVIVVTGAHHERVSAAIAGTAATIIHNGNWTEGMSSSIRAGIGAIDRSCRGVMLLVCDQPAINCADLQALTSAWLSNTDFIAAAEYSGTRGVPAIFPIRFRNELSSLQGDRGAKSIIAVSDDVFGVKMPLAAIDIDLPDDLNKIDV
jgi:molybdenum cofactor cytidylyltransferase